MRLTSCLVFAFLPLCMWCAHHCSNRRAFFPSGWYPLHALGSLCRRGLLRDQIRKTSLYTLHASFCFLFPLLYLEVHFGSFLNTTYWMSVCSHSHKITVTVDFATYLFSQDKNSEVVTITVSQLSENLKVAMSFTNFNVAELFFLSLSVRNFLLEFPPLRLTSCLVFAFSLLCMWCAPHCSNRRALFPSGWYLLHALGPLCRRGLLCDRIRKTYIYTLHVVFFFPPPFFLEVHFDPFECDVQDVSVQPLSQNNSDGGFCDVFIFTG